MEAVREQIALDLGLDLENPDTKKTLDWIIHHAKSTRMDDLEDALVRYVCNESKNISIDKSLFSSEEPYIKNTLTTTATATTTEEKNIHTISTRIPEEKKILTLADLKQAIIEYVNENSKQYFGQLLQEEYDNHYYKLKKLCCRRSEFQGENNVLFSNHDYTVYIDGSIIHKKIGRKVGMDYVEDGTFIYGELVEGVRKYHSRKCVEKGLFYGNLIYGVKSIDNNDADADDGGSITESGFYDEKYLLRGTRTSNISTLNGSYHHGIIVKGLVDRNNYSSIGTYKFRPDKKDCKLFIHITEGNIIIDGWNLQGTFEYNEQYETTVLTEGIIFDDNNTIKIEGKFANVPIKEQSQYDTNINIPNFNDAIDCIGRLIEGTITFLEYKMEFKGNTDDTFSIDEGILISRHLKFEGKFVDGLFHHGRICDGYITYEGMFKHINSKNKYFRTTPKLLSGTITYKIMDTVIIHKGSFRNNVLHGIGEIYSGDKLIQSGQFKYGNIVD
jgi:hypothetical protein